jgi:hypothetical protein
LSSIVDETVTEDPAASLSSVAAASSSVTLIACSHVAGVALYGEVRWVRNARAAGEVETSRAG